MNTSPGLYKDGPVKPWKQITLSGDIKGILHRLINEDGLFLIRNIVVEETEWAGVFQVSAEVQR